MTFEHGAEIKGANGDYYGSKFGYRIGCSKALAAAGATVVVNYPAAATEAARGCGIGRNKEPGVGTVFPGNVMSARKLKCRKMFADVIQQFGTVDILINNAGLQRDAPFNEMTLEQWNFVLGVNLTGQFLCAREAIREFLRRGIVPARSKAAGKIICRAACMRSYPGRGMPIMRPVKGAS